MKTGVISAILMSLLSIPVHVLSQEISDYLLMQDIGPYRLSQAKKFRTLVAGGPRVGKNAGAVGSAHFRDHDDMTYEISYLGNDNYVSPKVVTTKHAGVASDQWLLHEIEGIYRDSKASRLGLVLKGASIRRIGTNTVFSHRIGGGGYTWLSAKNIVVHISYTSMVAGKPEPTEIVQAYLSKFPSAIPSTLELDKVRDAVWIKDEMDYRLWLCDKWMSKIGPNDQTLYDKLDTIISNLSVFLDFRERYFGIRFLGISSKNEKNILLNHLSKKDEASIRAKLQEYKDWWSSHKANGLNL